MGTLHVIPTNSNPSVAYIFLSTYLVACLSPDMVIGQVPAGRLFWVSNNRDVMRDELFAVACWPVLVTVMDSQNSCASCLCRTISPVPRTMHWRMVFSFAVVLIFSS